MPRFLWDPKTGERHLFADDETPPEGLLDHHPDDSAKSAGDEPDDTADKPTAEQVAAEKARAKEAAKAAKEAAAAEKAAAKAGAEDKYPEMTADEIAEALKMAGFEYDAKSDKATLGDLLRAKLHEFLTANKTEYADSDDLKALLEKATS